MQLSIDYIDARLEKWGVTWEILADIARIPHNRMKKIYRKEVQQTEKEMSKMFDAMLKLERECQ